MKRVWVGTAQRELRAARWDQDRWLAILIGGGIALAGRGFAGWLLS